MKKSEIKIGLLQKISNLSGENGIVKERRGETASLRDRTIGVFSPCTNRDGN